MTLTMMPEMEPPFSYLCTRVAWHESKAETEHRRKPKRVSKRRLRAVPRIRNILQRLFGGGVVMGGAR